MASVDPPTPPTIADPRAPQLDRVIRILWYVLLAGFIVSMLTWMPQIWENVFNAGLAYSVIFLSITLITGMGGQLSLAQATLAGVGAFTAAELANHFGLNYLAWRGWSARPGRGGGGGAGPGLGAAAGARPRPHDHRCRPVLRQLGLHPDRPEQRPGPQREDSWVGLGILNPNGHAFFVLAMIVLLVCVLGVTAGAEGDRGPLPGGHAGQRDRLRRASGST